MASETRLPYGTACRARFLSIILACLATQSAVAVETNNPSGYDDRTFTFKHDSKLDDAIVTLEKQVEQQPTNADAIFNLAQAYRLKGKFDESLVLWNKYIGQNPTNDMAYQNRAIIHNILGNYDGAIEDFNKGIELNPNDPYAYVNRGSAYSKKHDFEKALSNYTQALKIDPHNEGALNNLAWLRANCPIASLHDPKAAVSLATQSCEMTQWRRWVCVDTLATAYAADGDFDNAVKFEEKAAGMSGISKNDLKELNDRLLLFDKHQPYLDK